MPRVINDPYLKYESNRKTCLADSISAEPARVTVRSPRIVFLCVRDHQFFEEHKTEYREWKMKRMGEQRFNLLMVRAHTYQKKDDTPVLMWLKQEMKKDSASGKYLDE